MQCDRTQSLAEFFSDFLLEPDPVKIALIGCGCSVATEPVAEISHRWNISQVYSYILQCIVFIAVGNTCLYSYACYTLMLANVYTSILAH